MVLVRQRHERSTTQRHGTGRACEKRQTDGQHLRPPFWIRLLTSRHTDTHTHTRRQTDKQTESRGHLRLPFWIGQVVDNLKLLPALLMLPAHCSCLCHKGETADLQYMAHLAPGRQENQVQVGIDPWQAGAGSGEVGIDPKTKSDWKSSSRPTRDDQMPRMVWATMSAKG